MQSTGGSYAWPRPDSVADGDSLCSSLPAAVAGGKVAELGQPGRTRWYILIDVYPPQQEYLEAYRRFLARLREARRQAGFTQAEAARRLGKSQSFLSKCESGERRMDFVELLVLAELYGVEISFFRP